MPAPGVPRARITLEGSCGPTPWASSVWFERSSNLIPAGSSMTDAADGFWGLFNAAVFAAWAPFSFTSTNMQTLRVDAYQSGSNASVANGSHTISGAAATGINPSAASQCVVVSLLTANQSKSGRGRMYLPATATTPAGTPYVFGDAAIAALATGMAAFLSDVNDATAYGDLGTLTAVVSSQGGLKPVVRPPGVSPINRVRVDSRPDRQEHREKNLVVHQSFASL